MADAPLTVSIEDGIAFAQMDDGKANALSEAMIDAMSEAISRAEKDASALVLVGRQDRFCAGFDLKIMMSGPENAKALLRRGSALLMKLYGCGVPLVIACTGHALAGGALVLLTGDVRIGALGAYRIGMNEVSIGLPVPILAMELVRDRIAKLELSRATLGAQIYDPAEAARVGYLDEAIAPDAVLARATAEAKRLGALSKTAYAATKKRLRGRTMEHVLSTLEADMNDLMPS
jgi:enoyl-CoA hydratase